MEVSVTTSDELETRIWHTKQVWKECTRKQSRFRHHSFLAAIFDLYNYIRSQHLTEFAFEKFGDDSKRRRTLDSHLFRVLLDATCKADPKVKSRWVRALRYAWWQRKHWSRLPNFFRRNGGISGCAAAFTETRRWKRERAKSYIQIPSDNNLRILRKLRARGLAHLARRVEELRRRPTMPKACPPRRTIADLKRLNGRAA
jgi:hypothetical protein